ncbi:MAG: 3-hydroxybutyryl-CoA dehydrogenase [Flavobacteriales bacterium]|nr:3-hydroxybutyryl-CoA dehydrogenase [Flavobacteriales bacterium]HRH69742.1 3-hydroxyacyl-CoA dehydrogenase NAD-binding domain-containing protein [Flavobacteriales bacterium]
MKVGVIGAGTMGSGIAQVAAQAGHTTYLFDTRPEAVDNALHGLSKTFEKLVQKGKITQEEATAIQGRIKPATDLKQLAGCGLVIEAIVEALGVKKALFTDLEALLTTDAVLATNTSSLSITAIAAACRAPERVIGLHFFNPAPLLPLVEVIPGLVTTPQHVERATVLMLKWGKTPVTCKDTPGFIVNRVARPFYGEAIRIHEEGIADMPTIDAAMRSVGFKMGPFELMDLIGNDINFAVTKSVFEAFFYDPRYRPSVTQQRQVESGRLGRKSGQGYYSYGDGAVAPLAQVDGPLSARIVERILAMLINEATDALFLNVASARDIDLAMTKGVNYPKGLLRWADEQGAAHWLTVLERLYADYGEDRYRPSPLLRRMVRDGKTFF